MTGCNATRGDSFCSTRCETEETWIPVVHLVYEYVYTYGSNSGSPLFIYCPLLLVIDYLLLALQLITYNLKMQHSTLPSTLKSTKPVSHTNILPTMVLWNLSELVKVAVKETLQENKVDSTSTIFEGPNSNDSTAVKQTSISIGNKFSMA